MIIHNRGSVGLLWLSLLASYASAAELRGKIVRISDGDTVTLLDADKVQHKVRLSGIDSPESKQAFGNRAKQHLGELIHEKEVRIVWTSKDRNGRIIGDVYLGERWINQEMIRDGFAWHFKRYDKRQALADTEKEAREAKRGLWADKEPVPPWEWRKSEAERRKAAKK